MKIPDELKELVFLGDTRRVLKALPVSVRQKIGRALGLIQTGDTPTNVKSLRGFMAWVQEIRVRHDKEAFRAVYTVSLGDRVYLLHVFQKKSKSGIGIPQRDMEIIRERLKHATELESARHA